MHMPCCSTLSTWLLIQNYWHALVPQYRDFPSKTMRKSRGLRATAVLYDVCFPILDGTDNCRSIRDQLLSNHHPPAPPTLSKPPFYHTNLLKPTQSSLKPKIYTHIIFITNKDRNSRMNQTTIYETLPIHSSSCKV